MARHGLPGAGAAFLLFLGALLAAGLLALAGLRTYPRDVATAAASAEAIGRVTAERKSGPRPDAEAEASSGVPAPVGWEWRCSWEEPLTEVFTVPEAGKDSAELRKEGAGDHR